MRVYFAADYLDEIVVVNFVLLMLNFVISRQLELELLDQHISLLYLLLQLVSQKSVTDALNALLIDFHELCL